MLQVEEVEKILQAYAQSGLSVVNFCHNYGISSSNFYYQKKWLQKQSQKPVLAPIVMQSEDGCSELTGRVQSKSNTFDPTGGIPGRGDEQVLEMKYPNGIELRLSGKLDPRLLHVLLTAQS